MLYASNATFSPLTRTVEAVGVAVSIFAGSSGLESGTAADDSVLYVETSLEHTAYEVFDMEGRLVLSGKFRQNKDHIKVKSLKTGIYVIKLTCNAMENTLKFIKK